MDLFDILDDPKANIIINLKDKIWSNLLQIGLFHIFLLTLGTRGLAGIELGYWVVSGTLL